MERAGAVGCRITDCHLLFVNIKFIYMYNKARDLPYGGGAR